MHPVRIFYILCFIWCLGFQLDAQTQTLAERAAAIQDLPASEFLEEALMLAEDFLEAGEDKNSQALAVRAHSVAKDLGKQAEMSLALRLQAQSLLVRGGRLNTARAIKLLKQSSDLAVDAEQKLANLELLRETALERGKEKELELIDRQIAILKYKEGIDDAEIQELEEQLAELESQTQTLTEEQTGLLDELAKKEEAIMVMNEEQMRVELMLMRQKSLLDSLSMMAMVDSLELEKQSMLLEKQNMVLQ